MSRVVKCAAWWLLAVLDIQIVLSKMAPGSLNYSLQHTLCLRSCLCCCHVKFANTACIYHAYAIVGMPAWSMMRKTTSCSSSSKAWVSGRTRRLCLLPTLPALCLLVPCLQVVKTAAECLPTPPAYKCGNSVSGYLCLPMRLRGVFNGMHD